jgi:predicted alpha-1,2-mannosidase
MRTLTAIAATILLPAALLAQPDSKPYDAVNPLIGTDGGGNTFPGATLPFGMVQWSPDTNPDAWYIYSEKKILGFSMTHLSGAGCGLYGDFAVLPLAAELSASPGKDIAPYAVALDHAHEEAHPGYYAITLPSGIRIELTAADRSGIARITFPAGTPARLLINAGSSANTDPSHAQKQRGYDAYGNQIALTSPDAFSGSVSAGGFCSSDSHYKLFVSGHFNKPYKVARLWQDDAVLADAKSASGKHTGAYLDFGDAHEVLYKIGLSYVSEAGAEANLRKEIPTFSFDEAHAKAVHTWTEALDRVATLGGSPDQRTIFYTGLYHSLIAPNLFSDEDGQYPGFDGKIHSVSETKQSAQYANFSDWDIYRNTVQLQSLLDAATSSAMAQSLVNDAVQSGWYPRWPAANDVTYVMNGDSPIPVIASSYAFGAKNFDTATALKYMVKSATQPGIGPHNDREREFNDDYLKLGYSPLEKDTSAASRTLEYASDDFSAAQFAKAIGHHSEYEAFTKLSENWKNILDPESGFIRPRNSDGSWQQGFDADKSLPTRPGDNGNKDQTGFEEGNTYQYSFMIPFDYPALFKAMGGEDKAIAHLDKFFLKLRCWGQPCYNIENEPDFVVPYAYDFAGQPWKTQEVVTRINKEVFKTTPEGIPGNDDLGATSGVYVWNALGLYPAVPGIGGLALGTPTFEKATLKLSGNRTLVITRTGPGIYVQKVTLDGAGYPSTWLPLTKLHTGVTRLAFTMAETPNTQRGTAIADRPPAFR